VPLKSGHLNAAQPEISGIRVLARADLSVLLEKRPQTLLKSLSDGHHRVARAVAAGLSNLDVAAITGRTATRIAMLKQDPAFIELVAHYRGIVTSDYVTSVDSYMEVATSNMLKAETMLGDKLDEAQDSGETLPTRDLIAISRDAADRFGYGKMQKNLNVNVDFASQLEAARKRSSQSRAQPPRAAPETPPALALSLGPTSFRRL
jgi:hypothetical protein